MLDELQVTHYYLTSFMNQNTNDSRSKMCFRYEVYLRTGKHESNETLHCESPNNVMLILIM